MAQNFSSDICTVDRTFGYRQDLIVFGLLSHCRTDFIIGKIKWLASGFVKQVNEIELRKPKRLSSSENNNLIRASVSLAVTFFLTATTTTLSEALNCTARKS